MDMKRSNRPWQRWDDPEVASAIDDYWTSSAYEASHRRILAEMVAEYAGIAGRRLLEVGCGSGLVYSELVPTVAPNDSYTGVDVSTEMLSIARSRHEDAQFVRGDAYDLPFGSSEFDVVTCFEVLVHLPSILRPIAELMRVSRRLVIFTVWLSSSGETERTDEKHAGVRFLHNEYSLEDILQAVSSAHGHNGWNVEVRVLSPSLWALVLLKDSPLAPPSNTINARIRPFPGVIEAIRRDYAQRIARLEQGLASKEAQAEQLQGNLASKEVEVADLQGNLASKEVEVADLQGNLASKEVEVADLQGSLATRDCALDRLGRSARAAAMELDVQRSRRAVRYIGRFLDRLSLDDQIAPSFQQLRDDSLLYCSITRGYKLQPSESLHRVPFLDYRVEIRNRRLRGVLLAPILDAPATKGSLGLEVVRDDGRTLIHVLKAATEIGGEVPLLIEFPPIGGAAAAGYLLRVFALDVDVPIRLFEWRKYSLFGLGPVQRRAFCGFVFAS